MTDSSAGSDAQNRTAAAYDWAAGLVALARRLVADGVDVDLSPIRPAVRELCDAVAALPKAEAAEWLVRLSALHHQLAELGRELAARQGNDTSPDNR
jgi:hypothetical protein